MNSFNWKEIIGDKKHFTDIPADIRDQFKTERQWAKLGFVAVNNSCGELLWANWFHANQFTYLHESEVREATKEELDAFFADEKCRSREARKKCRERQQLERKREEEEFRNDLTEARADATHLRKELAQARASFQKLCKMYSGLATYKADSGAWKYLKPAKRVVLDIETTGLTEYDELLQISILDADSGDVLFNRYIKPCFALEWPEAQTINGITPAKVQDAPYIFEMLVTLNAIFRSVEEVIGYSTNFDMGFLERAGVQFSGNVICHDVKETFAVVHGDYNEYHGDFKWQKLTVCAEELGYDWGEDTAHDSLSDCKATLFCYNELQKKEYVAKYEENLKMAAELRNTSGTL